MRLRPTLLTGLVLCIPSIVVAQRGGSRRGSSAATDPFAQMGSSSGPSFRARDLEDFDPLKILIDKKKDLKLSDAQVDGFKQSDEKMKEANKPAFDTIDSLMRVLRPGAGEPSEVERIQMQVARRTMMETIDSVKAHYEVAGKDAVATLDAEQQAKANELIAKKREDAEKRVRDRMNPRRGGGGASAGAPGGMGSGGPPLL